jgi:hypothetical protein
MFLLVFIVWWTMFHGRKPDQRPPPQSQHSAPTADDRPE